MKIEEIVKVLEAQILYIPDGYDVDISTAGASDLLSDVLAYVAEDILLITGLLSPQVIRTANLMDISAVVFVRGKVPSQEIIDEAKKANIAIIGTSMTTFTSCGLLYGEGIRGLHNHAGSRDEHESP